MSQRTGSDSTLQLLLSLARRKSQNEDVVTDPNGRTHEKQGEGIPPSSQQYALGLGRGHASAPGKESTMHNNVDFSSIAVP